MAMLLGPILYTLGALAIVAFGLTAVLLVGLLAPPSRERLTGMTDGAVRWVMALAWVAATLATVGSLYLSEGAGLAPCEFCWYQRIAMYPLVVVLGVALLRGDWSAWRYGLPLSVAGLIVAGYHIALQLQPALEIKECSTAVPCTVVYFRVYGFISVPVLAISVFGLVTAILAILALRERRQDSPAV